MRLSIKGYEGTMRLLVVFVKMDKAHDLFIEKYMAEKVWKTSSYKEGDRVYCMLLEKVCQVWKHTSIRTCNLLSRKCRKLKIVPLVTFLEKIVRDSDLENNGIVINLIK